MRIPDFFVIGAPKCGTTSLSEYLSRHPQICFSATKEPHFYADDFPAQKLDGSKAAYWRRNFSNFDPTKHKMIGEGSVFYYLSDVAVPNILDENPRAKFIYMIRDPVELAHSFCASAAEKMQGPSRTHGACRMSGLPVAEFRRA